MNLTNASLTPADKLSNLTVASPFVTTPVNSLPSTVIITVPLALFETVINASLVFG